MWPRATLFLALLPSIAVAGPPTSFGNRGTIYFNDCGVWNDPDAGAGVVLAPEYPQDPPLPHQDISYGGSGSNRMVVQWTEGGVPMQAVADSVTGACDWNVQSFTTGAFRGANSGLVMRKGETLGRGIDGSSLWYLRAYGIGFEFENVGDSNITDLRVFHASDPEIDEALNGDENTVNDVYDSNAWGYDNWAIAMGEASNITFGYYACEEGDSVGFLAPGADPNAPFIDPDGASGDLELAWRSAPIAIAPGDSGLVSMTFLAGGGVNNRRDWGAIAWSGTTLADHYAIFRGPRAGCSVVDQDDDGLMSETLGGLDCNDQDPMIGASTLYWRDQDGDGFGDPDTAFRSCFQPGLAVPAGGAADCDDTSGNISPTSPERCDGIDNDCDDDIDEGLPLNTFYADTDMDGFGDPDVSEQTCEDAVDGHVSNAEDCDDSNSAINPDAAELAGNSVDENCDASWDCFVDADGDDFGVSDTVASVDDVCTDDGESTNALDCDDANGLINPNATEVAGNSVDEDCDASWDCFVDADGDDYGISDIVSSPDSSCTDTGEATNALDCNDEDAAINPDATELAGNSVDENCDGSWDCFVDADGDDFGASDTVASDDDVCTDDGESTNALDCDDANGLINPNATEVAGNSVDEDCDASWDCFVDADGDDYGVSDVVSSPNGSCTDTGEATNALDCNDEDAAINPDATELAGNSVDENCDASWDCFVDADGDDFGVSDTVASDDDVCTDDGESTNSLDCDDANALINPNATEVAGNNVDEDCDGAWDCFVDADGDDYGISDIVSSPDSSCADDGESDNALDCDDTDASINPGGTDVVGVPVDADCNLSITCFVDADGDGFGDIAQLEVSVTGESCDTDTTSSVAGDCNDANADVFPGAEEVPGNDVDEDCDGEWDCFVDEDGDGFAADDAEVIASDDADCDGAGEASDLGDCDDTDGSVSPDGVDVVGSGIDADCDGFITCYVDADGDGFGDPDAEPVLTDAADCDDVDDASSDNTDCDDTEADINPAADEIEDNAVDEDCDGVTALSDEPDTDVDTDSDSDDDLIVQGGCGCDSGGQNAGWLVLGLLPLALRRRRQR